MDHSPPFETQLSELLPRLRRFAHALSRDAADADDLTQASIERALRSQDQWQAGSLSTRGVAQARNIWSWQQA